MKDSEHLQWLHDRIVNVYGENRDVDYLIRMRQTIERTKEQEIEIEDTLMLISKQ